MAPLGSVALAAVGAGRPADSGTLVPVKVETKGWFFRLELEV
jgi:hypothetical protein